MAVEVRKKTDESVEGMIRRFTKRVQQSGVVWRAKKGRFYTPPKSKAQLRKDAKRRREMVSKREYLRKIGKLDETEERGNFRKRR
ncbi:MAG: 30S ribosomal protein S21 [Patescibacteria group bacterium]